MKPEAVAALTGLDRATKWRLILGKTDDAAKLPANAAALVAIDSALGALYDESGERQAGLGASAPRLSKWLGDLRKHFPPDLVTVVQKDALERKGLTQLLLEPELVDKIEPSVELAATLLALKGAIPDSAKEGARKLVRKVADDIIRRLQTNLVQSLRGALDRSRGSVQPRMANFDIRRTLRRNLRNYDRERAQLVLERPYFHARRHRQFEWSVIVCLDQSGSMASSVIYGAVMASILASMQALRMHLVAFETNVVDLSEQVADPVDVLMGVQLGGGTDINKAVTYCQGLVREPRKTLFVLVSDLIEGGHENELVQRMETLKRSGVACMTLLALNDEGSPSYDHGLAKRLVELEIPCFACGPDQLAEVLEAALKGDLSRYVKS